MPQFTYDSLKKKDTELDCKCKIFLYKTVGGNIS